MAEALRTVSTERSRRDEKVVMDCDGDGDGDAEAEEVEAAA